MPIRTNRLSPAYVTALALAFVVLGGEPAHANEPESRPSSQPTSQPSGNATPGNDETFVDPAAGTLARMREFAGDPFAVERLTFTFTVDIGVVRVMSRTHDWRPSDYAEYGPLRLSTTRTSEDGSTVIGFADVAVE